MAFALSKLLGKGKRGQIKPKWLFDSKKTILAAPAIANIDGNGQSIIFATNDGKVFCLAESGQQKWIFDATEQTDKVDMMFMDSDTANSILSTPTVVDVTKNDQKEILFGSEMGFVFMLNSKGQLLWKRQVEGSIRGNIVVEDVNDDGDYEIIFGSGDKSIYILDMKGNILYAHESDDRIEGTPLVHQHNIIYGTDSGKVFCINHEGVFKWQFETEAKVVAQPAVGRIKGENHYFIASMDQHVYALSENGELIWKFRTNGAVYGQPTIMDIDKDGNNEIVFGSCDNTVYALRENGDLFWKYETDFWIVGEVIVTDIDGDGKLEVIAGSYDHNIYILDARGKYVLDYVPGLAGVLQQTGSYSEIATAEPGRVKGSKIWQFQSEGVVVGCAQNKNNIVFSTRQGKVYSLEHRGE